MMASTTKVSAVAMAAIISMVMMQVALVTSQCPAGEGRPEEDKKGPPAQHLNIILVGATGDLATRYLWPGLFDLFRRHYEPDKHHFSIYACGRKNADEGRKIISQIMLSTGPCTDLTCRKVKTAFVSAVQYHPLATEKDYKALATKVNENTQSMYALLGTEFSSEEGRLVYLAIPPSAYAKTASLVHKHLRPQLGRPWFRVVLEKPFGSDLSSAQTLAEEIGENFEESEIYRIDHYLGKPVVKYILPFRQFNRKHYDKLWNSQHIERVEIVMKEKIDAKGRTSFFDEVGIIRDVMQNHLTEIMSLVAMELPHDPSNISLILKHKIRLLKQIVPSDSILVGQYASYVNESQKELKKPDYVSKTPTFAATVFHVNNQRWKHVPFVLVSGKKLDVKSSHVRIVFKPRSFCVNETSEKCLRDKKQLLFQINSGDLKRPSMIVLSKDLPPPKETPGWKLSELKLDSLIFGENINDTVQLLPTHSFEAYSALIEAVYEGQRHLFIDSESLFESWKIWTPILGSIENKWPRIYEGLQEDLNILDFEMSGTELKYTEEDTDDVMDGIFPQDTPTFQQLPTIYRNDKLVSGDLSSIIAQLARSIESLAKVNIQQNGVFHMAVSGGNSPLPLLRYLATTSLSFPWEQTHLWWVDERCVPFDDPKSNFNMVLTNLLPFVNIPYLNVHPIPVHLGDKPCSEDFDAAAIYLKMLSRHIPDLRIDFVLLGVGGDGHTASLFPGRPSLNATTDLVVHTTATARQSVQERLTLTLPLINKAKNIAFLVTGQQKHDILHKLADGIIDIENFPVTGIKPVDGEIVWYADYDAVIEKP